MLLKRFCGRQRSKYVLSSGGTQGRTNDVQPCWQAASPHTPLQTLSTHAGDTGAARRRGSPKSNARWCIPVTAVSARLSLGPEHTDQSKDTTTSRPLHCSQATEVKLFRSAIASAALEQGITPPYGYQLRFRSYITFGPRKVTRHTCIDRCRHPWSLLVSAPKGSFVRFAWLVHPHRSLSVRISSEG